MKLFLTRGPTPWLNLEGHLVTVIRDVEQDDPGPTVSAGSGRYGLFVPLAG